MLLLPVFFGMGWFAARIDIRTILKQAKTVPESLYQGIDALVNRQSGTAAQALATSLAQDDRIETLNLSLALGRLYRQRGENDKAIALHQKLLQSPDLVGQKHAAVVFELGQDYQSAGLVDRAEQIFEPLLGGDMDKPAREVLLNIYQQDRDWQKAIDLAQTLGYGVQSYQFEIAQFYCEIAQNHFIHSRFGEARHNVHQALAVNRKCTRANMILGDIYLRQENFQAAIEAFGAIERQNPEYLSMVGERLMEAYSALDKTEEGLNTLIGYTQTFPQLDLLDVVYEYALRLYGELKAAEIAADLVRARPSLRGVYRLLGLKINDMNPLWRADADMMRNVVGRALQKTTMYRCRHCHFKSQVFFWHCPACNKWETFTPNKIEV